MSTTVDEIITDWLDGNATDIIRDELDVESEVEHQVIAELDKLDMNQIIKECVQDCIETTDFADLKAKFDCQEERIDGLEKRLNEQREYNTMLAARLEKLEVFSRNQAGMNKDFKEDISDLILRVPTKRWWHFFN